MMAMQKEKEIALEKQTALLLQINSESDPDWIEIVLKRSLGMAPEEYRKVFFEAKVHR